jgi:hypothetical protein
MTNLEIVCFSPDAHLVRLLSDSMKLPYLVFIHGNGIEATSAAKLDALLVTWMQAEYFGITPKFEPHKAEVLTTPQAQVNRGLPPLFVAGVMLKSEDPRDPAFELCLLISAALDAIARFNLASTQKITRLGVVAEMLRVEKIGLRKAAEIIDAEYAAAMARHEDGMS